MPGGGHLAASCLKAFRPLAGASGGAERHQSLLRQVGLKASQRSLGRFTKAGRRAGKLLEGWMAEPSFRGRPPSPLLELPAPGQPLENFGQTSWAGPGAQTQGSSPGRPSRLPGPGRPARPPLASDLAGGLWLAGSPPTPLAR